MNSLKFLAFGKSWATGRDVIGRFRMREDCLLPRFDEEPGAVDALIQPEPVSWWRRLGRLFRFRRRGEPAGPAVVPPGQPAPDMDTAALGEQLPENAGTPAPALVPSAVDAPVNPFAAASAPALDAPAAAARGTAVQREFRFEHVTVVCNDLHDADVEVELLPASRRRRARPAVVEQPVLLNA